MSSQSSPTETEAMAICFEAIKGLEAEEQERILDWLRRKIGLPSPHPITGAGNGPATASVGATAGLSVAMTPQDSDTGPTPKAFMAAKRPASDVERIACLGFFLGEYRGSNAFKTADLTKLNTLAAQPRIGNISQAVKNAMYGPGYITAAGGGKRQLTARGEALVRALPDRTAVKSAIEAYPVRPSRRPPKRKSAKQSA